VLIRESGKDPSKKEENKKLLDEAVSLLEKSIELKESAEAYGRLAWAYSNSKKYKEAYQAAKKAVELDENYAWYHAGLGRILVELGKPEEAVKELTIAVTLDPEHVFAYLYLGVAYKELDNNELAKGNFEKAWYLALEKGDQRNAALAMDNASEIAPKKSLYFARSGEAYRMLGEYDKALVKFKRAVRIEPQPAWVYGSLGDVYRRKGDFKRAEENLKESLDLDPDFAWAYAHLGETFSEQGDLDRAKKNLKKAISLDPESAWAYASLGEVYRQKGKFKKAIKNLEKAIALHPTYALAYASLGRVYSDKGDHEEAVAKFKKALELDPDFAWAYNALAVIMHENIFDYKEALENAREAVRVESKAADKKNLIVYQSTLAEALVTAGRFDEAYRRTEEIISEADENSIVLNIKMVQIVSLLLRNQEGIARSKVDAFIEFYEDLPRDFENEWSYDGISHFLETQGELSYEKKDLLFSMIRLLKKEIDLSQFETVSKRYFNKEKISRAYFLAHNSLALILRNLGRREAKALNAF
jgi:tetratricopeptide (TPR) repeat protein